MIESRPIGSVDIGGTKVSVGLVSPSGNVLCRRDIPTAGLTSGELGVRAIEASLRECMKETGDDLAGIGIGCTGPVDPVSGVVGRVANLPGWQGLVLTTELERRFGVPVSLENDADAAALAESAWGSGAGVDRFLYITLSTGVGAGLVLNGQIYRGAGASHPEIGHHTIDPSGPLCYCGATGCWESLISGKALCDWYLAHDPTQRFTVDSFQARQIFNLHREHDPLATEVVDRLRFYLGLGLANLTTILMPDVIALGGGLTGSAELFLDEAIQVFRRTCGEVPAEKTSVVVCGLGREAGLLGAAAVLLSRSR